MDNLLHNRTRRLIGVALLTVAGASVAQAQGGTGTNAGTSPTAPAASAPVKKNADRTDPLQFLLDRKKPLGIPATVEDSLKNYRKEMRHMQEVVYKDLDKAASKKEQGQPPSAGVLLQLASEASARIHDIQDAYRDRGRELLTEGQRQQVDSLEAVWKRSDGRAETLLTPITPGKRPPLR
jgi:hypothetical protein